MAIMLPDWKPAPCAECGMAGVHHGVERWSLRLDAFLDTFTRPLDFLFRRIMPWVDRGINFGFPLVSRVLVSLGLATEVEDLSNHPSETAVALFEEAKARGIRMTEIRLFGLPRRLYLARFQNRIWTFGGLPRPARVQPSLSWIDDKAEMKRRFTRAGFPVAKGGLCKTEAQAVETFHALSRPVIVKPHEGSGGRHTTVHIQTEEELRKAFWNARQVSPYTLVEEELIGPVYRATLVGRKLAGVLRRDPPCVVGDGRRSIRELAAEENKNPLRKGPVFAYIQVDAPESLRELAWQKLTPESVLPKDAKAFLHFKVNWGVGGTSWDATEETHPENRKLFEAIGEYLGDDIAGLDFIISDISKPWQQEKCGIIECNSLPLIGNHHFPYKGPIRNVAGKVWDMIFPEARK